MSAHFDSMDGIPPGKLRDLIAAKVAEDDERRAKRGKAKKRTTTYKVEERRPTIRNAEYSFIVPIGPMSMNVHQHWAARSRYVREVRTFVHLMTQASQAMTQFDVPVEIEATPRGVRHDALNDAWAVKAAVDGLVDAGVLEDDRAQFVRRVIMNASEPDGEPSLRITVRPYVHV